MTRLASYLNRQSKLFLIMLGLALVILIGMVDYATGPELASSIFYLIPVSLAAWFAGRRAGVLISFASAISWFVADAMAAPAYSHIAIPFWNAVVNFGFFLVITYVLSALRFSRDRQEELMEFVVHDLRSPLSNIMIGLETLSGEPLDATQTNLVRMCLMSSSGMLTLINSLLDLARLESGQMPLQVSQVNVKELIESSFAQVALAAQRRHVTLAPQSETQAETVYADRAMTVRVLVNLLGNAIKFSPSESTVSVRVTSCGDNTLAFSVTDHGPGIPKEWTDKVFDKFAQIEARKVGGAVGSGLGLTFCRRAVEAQGGRIWLESDRGKGTTATFTLPVTAQ
jgi:signal transduction histidine kinase